MVISFGGILQPAFRMSRKNIVVIGQVHTDISTVTSSSSVGFLAHCTTRMRKIMLMPVDKCQYNYRKYDNDMVAMFVMTIIGNI